MITRVLAVTSVLVVALLAGCSQEVDTGTTGSKSTGSTGAGSSIMLANSGQLKEGDHYFKYDNLMASQLGALATADVVEFFSYGCGHCQQFAPQLEAWHKQNASKGVTYVPVVWNQQTGLYARVYYAIETLPNFEEIHHEMFKLFSTFGHEKSLGEQLDKIYAMLTEQGVDAAQVKATLESKALEEKLKNSIALAKHYEVTGTPSLVLNGDKRVNHKILHSQEDLFVYVNKLLAM